MKSGLIVYVVGKEPPDWDAAFESTNVKRDRQADRVEIITTTSGHFDVLDAWWSLLTKGMKRVTCIMGTFSPAGELTLSNRELHLCG